MCTKTHTSTLDSRLRDHVGLGPVARLIAMLLKCVFAALADQVKIK